MSLDNDIYGRTVDMTTDGVTDTYVVGGTFYFAFATGTPLTPIYKSFAVQGKMLPFKSAVQDFINNRYDLPTRINFLTMYLNATKNSLTNRLIYLDQLMTWATAVIAYSAAFQTTVAAGADAATIAAINWNFSTLETSDPLLTLGAAIAISN